MLAIGYADSLPIDDPDSLFEFETPRPEPGPRDVLVRVRAVSVNPLDAVQRIRKQGTHEEPVILGYDGAGEVIAVGSDVRAYKIGDHVMYAGSMNRPGSNAQYQLVDSRVIAHVPKALDFPEAASLPLVTITAWEALFDRLGVPLAAPSTDPDSEVLLIIGAAGGVGSLAIQLARQLTAVQVVATASRPETIDWVTDLGADKVIDHRRPLKDELARVGVKPPKYILSLANTNARWDELCDVLAPQGHICAADNPGTLDMTKLRYKAGAFHLQMMWVRVLFETPDIGAIHHILSAVAAMVDRGAVRHPVTERLGDLSAESLRAAHRRIESGTVIGKLVLNGMAE